MAPLGKEGDRKILELAKRHNKQKSQQAMAPLGKEGDRKILEVARPSEGGMLVKF